jgi:hypothetical protein
MPEIKYKFHEDHVLKMVKAYIDETYVEHYSKGNIQSTEVIFDAEHGEGFCIGNILKYAQRYGKKEGKNDADLYKIIHYTIMLLGMKEEKEVRDFREYEIQMSMDMD